MINNHNKLLMNLMLQQLEYLVKKEKAWIQQYLTIFIIEKKELNK